MTAETVIWHDLECGGYRQDLRLWTQLAADSGDPILDIGAGTGRVSLALAQAGHTVVALDLDPELLAALAERAAALPDPASARVSTVAADARDFDLGDARFALCVVPMQTLQLLGGADGRAGFFASARRHLAPGGVLALAIAADFDEFAEQEGDDLPLADIVELEGTIYSSQPTAVRVDGAVVVLERRREIIDPVGGRQVSDDRIDLDILGAATVMADGVKAGLRPVGTRSIAETEDHVGSLVVVFRA